MKIYYCIIFIVLFFQLSGCASAKVTMLGTAYSPKSENATIEVFMTTRPTQPYIELARIVSNATNDDWNLTKARAIGADAVIITGKAVSAGVGIPIGYLTYVATEEYGMTAIAIKYKQQ
jgi:hypothetical protein